MATDNPNTIITTITKQLTHDLDVNVGNKSCFVWGAWNYYLGCTNGLDPNLGRRSD